MVTVSTVFGTLFLVIGLGTVIVPAIYARPVTTTIFDLPPRSDLHAYLEFFFIGGGRIWGNYLETGHSINLYVFDEDQYTFYKIQGIPQALFTSWGTNGLFSATLSTTGKLYLVVDHGANYDYSQRVRINFDVLGVELTHFAVGVGLLCSRRCTTDGPCH